ncbi:hypothetical protein HYQ46_010738 [Verticillium longisporum]|nr:hypothetical protein HYQ46_010738 [Verticillium longisporum]
MAFISSFLDPRSENIWLKAELRIPVLLAGFYNLRELAEVRLKSLIRGSPDDSEEGRNDSVEKTDTLESERPENVHNGFDDRRMMRHERVILEDL